jgi:hypothetical protein
MDQRRGFDWFTAVNFLTNADLRIEITMTHAQAFDID